MPKKFSSLMELRDKLITEQSKIKTPDLPKFESLSDEIKLKFHVNIRWWILQAQIDLLSQIIAGNVASNYQLESYQLQRQLKPEHWDVPQTKKTKRCSKCGLPPDLCFCEKLSQKEQTDPDDHRTNWYD